MDLYPAMNIFYSRRHLSLMCLRQVIFKANVGVEIYIDNVLKSGDTLLGSANITPDLSGHIVIGRYGPTATYFGIVTVDWLTIWDRVLTEEERNLAHLD